MPRAPPLRLLVRRRLNPAYRGCTEPRPAGGRLRGWEPTLGRTVVRGVDHLVVDVAVGVAVRWPARPDVGGHVVDAVHEHRSPDLAEVGLDLDRRSEHSP